MAEGVFEGPLIAICLVGLARVKARHSRRIEDVRGPLKADMYDRFNHIVCADSTNVRFCINAQLTQPLGNASGRTLGTSTVQNR